MTQKNENLLLKAALDYHKRGWCIIPIAADKKPPKGFKWKRYQTERPSEADIREWFGSNKYESLAVMCGAVSGGLACRDFDTEQEYKLWAGKHPELAKILPTVRTARGYHVYFEGHLQGIKKIAR